MIRSSLVLLLLFLSFSHAQNRIDLDSLYYKFLEHKSPRSSAAFTPDDVKPSTGEKCGFGLAADVRLNFDRFSSSQQAVLKRLLERPQKTNEYISPFGHFRIHYDETGRNRPRFDTSKTPQQNIDILASILDSVYSMEVLTFGYPPPPGDNGEGGDNLFDIYVEDMGYPYYGETQPENNISENTYTSYIRIDNDFFDSRYPTRGVSGAKVTIAHELHHAIQIGNYALRSSVSGKAEDLFFLEMTATAMEEFVYDYINDYYDYLDDYFRYPDRHFLKAENGYEFVLWNLFMSDRFGIDIIKKQWELFRDQRAVLAINTSIVEAGSSFKRELNLFGIRSYYTGYRKEWAVENALSGDTYGYFEEGENYPLLRIDHTMKYAPNLFPLQISSMPMSNNYIKIINFPDTVISIVTNGNISALISTPNSFFNFEYSLFDEETEGSKHMVNDYFYIIESADQENYTESNILTKKVVTGGEFRIVESDYAYPTPFYYKESRNVYIPVAANQSGEARLYIYTSNMDLVYEGVEKIITPFDRFVLEWNARDADNNRLSSGVYIYITRSTVDSGDEIRKGKIVIFAE